MNHRCHVEGEGLAEAINYTPNSHSYYSVWFSLHNELLSFPLMPCRRSNAGQSHAWLHHSGVYFSIMPHLLKSPCMQSVLLKTKCWITSAWGNFSSRCQSASSLSCSLQCWQSPRGLCLTTALARISKRDSSWIIFHLSLSDDTVHFIRSAQLQSFSGCRILFKN